MTLAKGLKSLVSLVSLLLFGGIRFHERRPLFLFLALLAVPACLLLFGWASVQPSRLGFHYPPSIPEHQSIVGIHAVAHGEVLYRDWQVELPVVPLTFGTMFYKSYGNVLGWVTDGSPHQLFRLGRWLTLLFFLALVALLSFVALRGSTNRIAGGLIPLLIITAFPYPAEWTTKILPDIAALFFGFLGWALARRGLDGTGWKPYGFLAAGALSWVIAFHFKPTLIHGEILFAVEAIHRAFTGGRPWREAIQPILTRCLPVGLAVVAGVIVTALWVNQTTNGLWYSNQVESIAHREKSIEFIRHSFVLWRLGSTITLLGLVAIALVASLRVPALAAMVLMLPFDLAMMRLQGSNVNHLLGSIVLGGIGLRQLVLLLGSMEWRPALTARIPLIGGAVLLFVGMVLTLPNSSRRTWEGTRESPRHVATVLAMIGEAEPGRVLFLDAYMALLAGEQAIYADGYHGYILEEDGLEIFHPIAERIARGDYDLVVANQMLESTFTYHRGRFTPLSIREEIFRQMKVERIGNWLVVATPDDGRMKPES